MSWYEHYVDRMNARYLDYVRRKYGPFIDMVRELMPATDSCRVAEIGCGAANVSRILQERVVAGQRCQHVLVDVCPNMLGLAKRNMHEASAEHIAILADAKRLPDSKDLKDLDVIHSHGVLEHFEDRHIARILHQQCVRAKHVIHYVPSHKYVEPSFGDERLMSAADWKDILSRYQLGDFEVREFNDGYDLALVWSR